MTPQRLVVGIVVVLLGWIASAWWRVRQERKADIALERARRAWADSIECYGYREPVLHLTEAQARQVMAKIFPRSSRWGRQRKEPA